MAKPFTFTIGTTEVSSVSHFRNGQPHHRSRLFSLCLFFLLNFSTDAAQLGRLPLPTWRKKHLVLGKHSPPLVPSIIDQQPINITCVNPAIHQADNNTNIDITISKQKSESYQLISVSNFVNMFPIWTLLFACIGGLRPDLFAWLTTEYFTVGLSVLMLSMGITLTLDDFKNVLKQPLSVGIQFIECYCMMPLLALLCGKVFQLNTETIAGLVLVGSINGGQASNLCTYIAKGDVALSVIMTTATTIGSIVFTPLIIKLILGAEVPVDAKGIALSTIQVVLVPIALGMTAKKLAPRQVEAVLPVAPLFGMLSTVMLVASAVSQVKDEIMNAGTPLQLSIILLHLLGGVFGYALSKALRFSETVSRTMAIETSMKSSAFGFLLAKLYFPFYSRVPPAVSVVWMSLIGSSLAVAWKFTPVSSF